jgi:hypothetical protein
MTRLAVHAELPTYVKNLKVVLYAKRKGVPAFSSVVDMLRKSTYDLT